MASITDRWVAVTDGAKVRTARYGIGLRYQARWREHANGPQKTQHFARKVDAQRFLTTIEHDLLTGRYVDPSAGRVTVAAYAQEWTSRRNWRPATRDRVEGELRLHILPTFGDLPIASIRRAKIEAWAATLSVAPRTARVIAETFATMLASAVEDELIARSPAVGAKLPRREDPPVVPLSVAQVRDITGHTASVLRAAVVLGAGTGLRQGEAMAVTVDRLDFLRRELRVDRQLWSPKGGQPVFAPPKSKLGYRTIALSDIVTNALAAHLAEFGTGADGLVFHLDGAPIGRAKLARRFRAAAVAANVDASWHDLRHHHASVLLSAGVSPALVAERLGHDVKTLLSTYAHVIRADEDRVRKLVDDALGGTAEEWLTDRLRTG